MLSTKIGEMAWLLDIDQQTLIRGKHQAGRGRAFVPDIEMFTNRPSARRRRGPLAEVETPGFLMHLIGYPCMFSR